MTYTFLFCKIDKLWQYPREEEVEGNDAVEALANILWNYKQNKPYWYETYLYVFGVRNGVISSFQVEYEKALARCWLKEAEENHLNKEV